MTEELVPAIRANVEFTVYQALMACRYEPPKRRKAAWHIGWPEDMAEAKRVAQVIAVALDDAGYKILRRPPPRPHSF